MVGASETVGGAEIDGAGLGDVETVGSAVGSIVGTGDGAGVKRGKVSSRRIAREPRDKLGSRAVVSSRARSKRNKLGSRAVVSSRARSKQISKRAPEPPPRNAMLDKGPTRTPSGPSVPQKRAESTISASRAHAMRAEPPVRPHWWGQVRYRRCAIYFAVLGVGSVYAALSAWRDWRHGPGVRSTSRRAAAA